MEEQISMDQAFISKLDGILQENFHNEHFGVNELAISAGVSRSKLHRKLSEIKGRTASEFIKQFRLQKAYTLLKNNVSSISEIAYAVGFNSPSYFTKCFNDYYKCPPGEVKNKHIELEDGMLSNTNGSRVKKFLIRKAGIIIFGVLAIAIVSYRAISSTKPIEDHSETVVFGVLPFKNLSDDPSNQYFADGVMEVILNHLSSIEGMNVLSRTTMDQYRQTNKTVPEIARELNITHIMEASIQKDADRVRIVVQLIDAKQDKHLWAESYERTYQDIFNLQSDIAKEVAHQLQKTLSPKNLSNIEQEPTENVMAYNLYLKGRFFWHRRTREDLEKSVRYFEQAIQLDSTYALAYAGLADAYFIMAWWRWKDKREGFDNANAYAIKALSINPNIASAHATLGGIATWYDWDWESAEIEFRKAISIDPNYATAHQWYAELLNILGRKEEAREQIDKALEYNPNSLSINNISSIIYYNNKEFEKAIEASKRSFEISGDPGFFWFNFKCHIRLGQEQKAVDFLNANIPDSLKTLPKTVNIVYQEDGIKGVVDWYVENIFSHEYERYREMASSYALIGNSQKALEYLEKSFEVEDPVLPEIKTMIDFESLYNEDRFIALLKKMNLYE